MNLEDIKELIALMREHKISEIDLEQEGSKVRILAESPEPKVISAPPQQIGAPYFIHHSAPSPASLAEAPIAAPVAPPASPQPAAEIAATEPAPEVPSNLVEIHSPMVGTFYRAPAPDAPPYVEVGSFVNLESVLCIIEAMKLMNEVKAEKQGRIVKILVENGQPVEFNQPLFLVEPA